MNREQELEYLNSLQDGERVFETADSALKGWTGTVYHNIDGLPCVKWDRRDSEDGQLSTSVTHGTRRVFDDWIKMRTVVENIASQLTIDEGDKDDTEEQFGLEMSEVVEMAHDNFIIECRNALTELEQVNLISSIAEAK
tara:strand:- start:534 stop:950 length:417 start_codon:yes stop_codon:yes gene_type:complete